MQLQTVLIIGSEGMLSHDLKKSFKREGFIVIGVELFILKLLSDKIIIDRLD